MTFAIEVLVLFFLLHTIFFKCIGMSSIIKKTLLLCVFLSLYVQEYHLKAQNSIQPYMEGLNIRFDALESKKMNKAMDLLNQADAASSEANQLYDQLTTVEKKERITDEYQKALKKLFEASNIKV